MNGEDINVSSILHAVVQDRNSYIFQLTSYRWQNTENRHPTVEEGRAASKSLIENLAIFFLFPSKEFLPISFKIQLLETSPQKQKEQRQMQLVADKLVTTQIWKLKILMSLFPDDFSLPVHFEYYAIFE
jgi:hypothetical protein